MNTPPPKDMDDGDPRSTAAIEAQIAADAEQARQNLAQMVKDEAARAEIERALTIEKGK